ncbi:MAG: nucleotidyltransferase family protein [Actinomycetota bacterium]|nr:nucleotidyltransferase family protein [Actinomycetota bacterium]
MNVDRGHLVTDLPPGEEDVPRRQVTVEELRAHRDEIAAIGRRHGVSDIRIFGSVARGEADERSDLDLLIDVAPGHGYFDMAGFALDIEQRMGVFTQVATPNGLKPRMQTRIIAEAVPL